MLKVKKLVKMLESHCVVSEPEVLFCKGTKVSSQQIHYLTKLLSETKDLTLDYNPILERALKSTFNYKISNNLCNNYLFVGLIFFHSRWY